MIEIIGVRFKANGKVYYFSPGDHQFQTGDLVVVETSKGTECGERMRFPRRLPGHLLNWLSARIHCYR